MKEPQRDYRLLGDLLEHALVEVARVVELAAALLELDVGQPRLLVGEALHPSLKHRARRDDVARHFLEIGILVPANHANPAALPKLIHARQDGHGSVIHVARAVDIFVADLKLGVFQPDRSGRLIHVQGTLEDVPSAFELALCITEETRPHLLLLPLRILYVVSNVLLLIADALLKASALQKPKLGQFLYAYARSEWRKPPNSGFSGLPFCALPRVSR